eukprot:gene8734-biopygen6148
MSQMVVVVVVVGASGGQKNQIPTVRGRIRSPDSVVGKFGPVGSCGPVERHRREFLKNPQFPPPCGRFEPAVRTSGIPWDFPNTEETKCCPPLPGRTGDGRRHAAGAGAVHRRVANRRARPGVAKPMAWLWAWCGQSGLAAQHCLNRGRGP